VISEDLAFLAAHPTRRSNSETMARRREFNDATRQTESGDEFAAVVTTLPEADQQEIRTMVREILQERDQ